MIQDLENEIWKSVKDYEGLYEVSNMGRIKTLSRTYYGGVCPVKIAERLRKLTVSTKGYLTLLLTKDKKSIGVKAHRIVASHFIPNPENKPQVNHKNGIKTDNRVENLEWATNKENCVHAWKELKREAFLQPTRGLNPNARKVKCDTLDISFDCGMDAAEVLGVSGTAISSICRGLRTQTKGLTFRYI